MGATYTEAQAKATKKYQSTLDELKVRVPKGKKDEYKKRAEQAGKTLNQFIIDCIEGQA